MNKPFLHRAALVVPVTAPVIANGAVLVQGGKVLDVGSFDELNPASPFDTVVIDHGHAALVPAFVNCHCHLGLSLLKGKVPRGLGFSVWLKRVMELISSKNMEGQVLTNAIKKGMDLSQKSGTGLIGDVSNVFYPPRVIESLTDNSLFVHLFLEIIHPLSERLELDKKRGDVVELSHSLSWSFSAHSVYTCSRQALRAIKKDCIKNHKPFSIHLCESREEIDFVRKKSGPIAQILKERGRNVHEFFLESASPVEILKEEAVVDEGTICVHCTYLGKKEMDFLSDKGAWVCLCPESNQYIYGDLPRADEIFRRVKRVCLGTDSLASNDNLSILSQLRCLYRAFPSIDPEQLFKAATVNGSMALGFGRGFGAILPGANASLLKFEVQGVGEREIFEYLCSEVAEEGIETIEPQK